MRPARSIPLLVALLAWAHGAGPASAQAIVPVTTKATATATPTPAAPASQTSDEQTLKAANLSATPEALLDFFRHRTRTGVDPEQVMALIRRLADPAAEARDRAFGQLVSLGPAAVAELRRAANNLDDLDAAARARQCLQYAEGPGSANLTRAAARLLGQLKPAGAAEVLLAYLPLADDGGVVDEVQDVLAGLALKDRQPDPAVLKALSDAIPVRRAVAAEALCRAGGPAQHERIRPLLKDPRPTVRLHAALGLARNHDAEAIPVLIDLLAELPKAERKLAEDYLTQLAGEWAVTVPGSSEEVLRHIRREVWKAWWESTTGANLLDEFRKRTLSEAEREKVLGLIRKLGDPDLMTREKASAVLLAMGPAAAPLLHQAVQKADAQARPYAVKCLELIEKDGSTVLPSAAVRLIALRKPAGAAEALLGYLPFAENDGITEELKNALAAVAEVNGRPDPVLVQALQDKVDARRAAAAEVLCRSGREEQLALVRPLLQDADLNVRLRAALALAGARDKQAVPVLIALLGEVPPEQSSPAADYLYRLAGDKAPTFLAANDAEARRKWRDAWADWWQKNGATVDLVKLEQSQRTLGLTLVIEQYHSARGHGRVFELDAAGKVLWQIAGLQYPLDAQYLPGDRVLIAEQNFNRVTERDLKGAILWQKQVNQPFRCQRLPNGNTLIGTRTQILEASPDGKEKVLFQVGQGANIAVASRLPNGRIAVLTYAAEYVLLDADGREVKKVPVAFLRAAAQSVDFLANGHVLASLNASGKVIEYNLDGKIFWEAKVPAPGNLTRLPNGNVLVVSQNSRLVELNRAGQTVGELKGDMLPWRAWRR